MRLYLIFILSIINTYIAFNILFSKDGVVGIVKLKKDKVDLEKVLNYKILPENENMEQKITFLTESSISPQYLEVVLKKDLSYSDKNEVLIITEDEI
jgi:cell division protein FtsB